MDIKTLENDIDDLLAGYKANGAAQSGEGEGFTCLWCGEQFAHENAAQRHLGESHPPAERFNTLINSILLDWTENEKKVLQRLFEGMEYGEITAQTGAQSTSIRGIRRRAYRKELEGKAALMFADLWRASAQPAPRGYQKKAFDYIPGIDEEGRITGLHTIAELHSGTHPIRHGTAIVLVAQWDGGKPNYLVVDKSMAIERHIPKKGVRKVLDSFGGHCKCVPDVAPEPMDFTGMPLTREVYRKTAKRELEEELVLRKRPLLLDKALIELFETHYQGEFFYGKNHETSMVYLFVLPRNISIKDVIVYDSWEDSLGERVRKRYRAEFLSGDALLKKYHADPSQFNDGLARVLQRFEADPAMKEKVERLIKELDYDQEEGGQKEVG